MVADGSINIASPIIASVIGVIFCAELTPFLIMRPINYFRAVDRWLSILCSTPWWFRAPICFIALSTQNEMPVVASQTRIWKITGCATGSLSNVSSFSFGDDNIGNGVRCVYPLLVHVCRLCCSSIGLMLVVWALLALSPSFTAWMEETLWLSNSRDSSSARDACCVVALHWWRFLTENCWKSKVARSTSEGVCC